MSIVKSFSLRFRSQCTDKLKYDQGDVVYAAARSHYDFCKVPLIILSFSNSLPHAYGRYLTGALQREANGHPVRSDRHY
ncbi:hypothetical protein CEXT_387411 [Caerostris extrusa]|uniref:Uncharacterized protein n=1 Tax=Caerostris extrusa TaxID=172846 RepID=A0AAV4P126_CAEEX|nr:hypothetical protein CEXT_387411 [Caerostris extrusa]